MINKISFKATIQGINNFRTKEEFESETRFDKKHSMTLLNKEFESEPDTFVLTKNGKQTITYQPEFITSKDGNYTTKQLVRIFNTMKAIEAREFVKESMKAKQEKIKAAENQHLMEEVDAGK